MGAEIRRQRAAMALTALPSFRDGLMMTLPATLGLNDVVNALEPEQFRVTLQPHLVRAVLVDAGGVLAVRDARHMLAGGG